MEWKKIASLEYGKIIFHFIPCPDTGKALYRVHQTFVWSKLKICSYVHDFMCNKDQAQVLQLQIFLWESL